MSLKKVSLLFIASLLIFLLYSTTYIDTFPWLNVPYKKKESLKQRISLPERYERISVKEGSFAHWLRNLPLKPGKPPVFFYDGSKKGDQTVHHAVIDIDTGESDLQQCADAIIRLKAEHLYSIKKFKDIHFNFTSGDNASFIEWSNALVWDA